MLNCAATDIVMSIGNQQITGKDCVISEMTISHPNNLIRESDGIVTVDLSLKCLSSNFFYELFDGDFKPKIRNKKVEECSIPELLYAIRCKVNIG